MSERHSRLGLLLAVLAATACGSTVPEPSISDAIRLVHVTTVGSADGPGLICRTPQPGRADRKEVAVLSSGHIALPGCACGQVAIFAPSGEHARTVGQCGPGPGELERIHSVVAAGDRLFVAGVPPKVLAFDPGSGELAREITIESYPSLKAVLPEYRLVLAYPRESEGGTLHALHVHEAGDEPLISLQPIDPGSGRQTTYSAAAGTHVLQTPEGNLWSVRAWQRYEIFGYDARGQPLARHTDAEWFRPYDEPWSAARAAIHAAVWRNGLIWIAAQYPLEWWEEELSVAQMFAGEVPPTEFFVAALDPETGDTVARLVLDRQLTGGADGLFYRPETDEAGTIRIEFYRPELEH